MHWLTNLLMTIQVLSAIGVITLVLLQHGKGADMGAAFGSGASGSLFGATGSANFLSRTTAVLAAVFFACTLGLALLVNTRAEAPASVMDTVPAGGQDRPAPAPGPADVPSTTPADVPSAAPRERCPPTFRPRPPDPMARRKKMGRLRTFRSEYALKCAVERTSARLISVLDFPGCRRGEIGRHAILRG